MELLATLLTVLLPAARAAGDPIPLELARRAFREVEEASLEEGGELWGCELHGPLLLADPGTRAVVANQPDEEQRLEEREGVFVGTLPAEVGVANTALEWAGVRWTMVAWPLPEERYARVRLLLHECFHRIQPELRHGGGDALNLHLDLEQGRTWLRLEFRALAEALIRRGAERERAISDAFLFRARRRELFADARALESAFERNEGLAEYTGLALCGLPAWVLADRAAVRLERDEASPSFVRSFAYATGPAYGVLLDEHEGASGKGWRAAIDAQTDLAALLARALEWKAPADLATEARRRAERYDGAQVVAAERARAAERAAEDERNRARFVSGPLLVLPLGAKVRYSFDPGAITPLEPLGSVYRTLHLADEWGVLEVTFGGALLERGAGGGLLAARVPAPLDAAARPVAGDGWTLALNEGWELAPLEREGDWKVVRAP
jgi:hypothetical protein